MMNTDCTFCKVNSESDYYPIVAREFRSIIEPIYGDQTVALDRIGRSEDRACEVLLNKVNNVAGIIVYKTNPTDEFSEYKIVNALDLKTLFVVNSKENSGKGIGSKLFKRVHTFAQENKFKQIVVTVSETKTDSLAFFKRKGFVEKTNFKDLYKQGDSEILLALKIEK